ARDYCPTSGQLIDVVLAAMFDLGLSRDDVRHLEKLSDAAVIRRIGRHLRFNKRDDVVLYIRTWADLLSAAHEDETRAERDHDRSGDAVDRSLERDESLRTTSWEKTAATVPYHTTVLKRTMPTAATVTQTGVPGAMNSEDAAEVDDRFRIGE